MFLASCGASHVNVSLYAKYLNLCFNAQIAYKRLFMVGYYALMFAEFV